MLRVSIRRLVSWHATDNQLSSTIWEPAFRRSTWFKRGWTLQELLAPASIEFFSREGVKLGSKESLEQHIHDITGIPIQALRGGPLTKLEVEERLSWAKHRETKRQEDKAYSLLGIFNINMSLIYGEGSEKAFVRLRNKIGKSSKLRVAPPESSKSFGVCLGQAPQIAADAFIGRADELQQLRDWLPPKSQPDRQRIISIVGMGGMGKTQLSLAHIRDCAGDYSSVFWVNAKEETSLRHSMADLSAVVFHESAGPAVQSVDDEKLKIDKVRRWLSEPRNDQWLLIFDNYDDPRLLGMDSATGYDIRAYFPHRAQGSILITTRSPRLLFAKQLPLKKLEDVEQSLAILAVGSGRKVDGGEIKKMTKSDYQG